MHRIVNVRQPVGGGVLNHLGPPCGGGQILDVAVDVPGLLAAHLPEPQWTADTVRADYENPLQATAIIADTRHDSPSFTLPSLSVTHDAQPQQFP
ncbi:MAG TPA: hypothetical protein VH518_07495 [Tepidisphaeraceae bacterium]